MTATLEKSSFSTELENAVDPCLNKTKQDTSSAKSVKKPSTYSHTSGTMFDDSVNNCPSTKEKPENDSPSSSNLSKDLTSSGKYLQKPSTNSHISGTSFNKSVNDCPSIVEKSANDSPNR